MVHCVCVCVCGSKDEGRHSREDLTELIGRWNPPWKRKRNQTPPPFTSDNKLVVTSVAGAEGGGIHSFHFTSLWALFQRRLHFSTICLDKLSSGG